MSKENPTLNNKLQNINSSFLNLFNEIGVIGCKQDGFDPSLFHSQNNLEKIYMEIDKHLQTMKSTAQQYRQWEGSKELPRFQTTLKQYHATQQKYNVLSKSISECSLVGKIYLDHLLTSKQKQKEKEMLPQTPSQQNPSPNTIRNNMVLNEGRRKLSLLASKFQEMTYELDQKYGTYSDLEELNNAIKNENEIKLDSVYSCNISSSTFLLDIFVYGNGDIQQVKLVHISMQTSEIIQEDEESQKDQSEELSHSLKSDIKEFIVKLKKICHLDLIFRKLNQFDLQKAFLTFQNDFKLLSHQIQQQYPAGSDNEKDKFLYSFGKINIDCCGIKINYFNHQSTHYNMFLEIEESSKPNRISLIPTEIENLQFKYQDLLDNFVEPPIQFLIKLENTLTITKKSLYNIKTINNKTPVDENEQQLQQHQNSKDLFEYSNKFSIQNQILSKCVNSKSNDTIQECNIEIYNSRQKYFYTGEYHLGLQVSKFPIHHLSEILPIIQILRQEIIWSLLFKSCFQPFKFNSTLQDHSENSQTIFEITSEPPQSISIIYLNSNENIFHSIEISVELGGEIKVEYYENNQENQSKSNYLGQLLKKSLSIPLAFYFLVSGNTQ
ncbi:hypothetical protein DLAC_07908 [Tieghemostelium lacteum]|uniref:Mediator of RNA polymerase II transcription subunit 1 n=1 Tax=Tieghemostelium lacteum TaxID=361077 RepID=A0A151ZAP2_TIELA|nr:hypothetical protein DLAC_07908 [Tieghemostelium lacteum]|eukprot:KYQ91013.1 hypothetical protein DLAC_07908 [Tieghemostelium lacteum]